MFLLLPGVEMMRVVLHKIKKEELIEDTVYSEQAREELIENDEISAEEEAFMQGWDDAG